MTKTIDFHNSLHNSSRLFFESVKNIYENKTCINSFNISTYDNLLALLYYKHGDVQKARIVMEHGIERLKILIHNCKSGQLKQKLIGMLLHYTLNFARLQITFGHFKESETLFSACHQLAIGRSTQIFEISIDESVSKSIIKKNGFWPQEILMNNICQGINLLYNTENARDKLFLFFDSAYENPIFKRNYAVVLGYIHASNWLEEPKKYLPILGQILDQSFDTKYLEHIHATLELANLYFEMHRFDNCIFLLNAVIKRINNLHQNFSRFIMDIIFRTIKLFFKLKLLTKVQKLSETLLMMAQINSDEIVAIRSLMYLSSSIGDSAMDKYVKLTLDVADNSLYVKERSKAYFHLAEILKERKHDVDMDLIQNLLLKNENLISRLRLPIRMQHQDTKYKFENKHFLHIYHNFTIKSEIILDKIWLKLLNDSIPV